MEKADVSSSVTSWGMQWTSHFAHVSPPDMAASNRRIQIGSASSTVSNAFCKLHSKVFIKHPCACSPQVRYMVRTPSYVAEHCVPNRDLNTAAKHMLNSNTWVILLMISLCLSALLDLSQSALCLAKLNSKWDKTSPTCWRKGKDLSPTWGCQKRMGCSVDVGRTHYLQNQLGLTLIRRVLPSLIIKQIISFHFLIR